MVKLGVNSVLFQEFDFATAVKYIAMCGYDGVEISAIAGMCEHLQLPASRDHIAEIKNIVADAGLKILATEVAALDENRLLPAFEAAAAIGIPVVNVGPGGASDVEADVVKSLGMLTKMATKAAEFGVTLCVKAHVKSAIYNTPTTLRAMREISAPAFGIDMDPSHIYRAGENPEEALGSVVARIKHVHIRDCKGRQTGPGAPRDQACGRGDINLAGYCRVLVDAGYDGPVCLEVIGAKGLELPEVCTIAAESYGYLNACFKSAGGR